MPTGWESVLTAGRALGKGSLLDGVSSPCIQERVRDARPCWGGKLPSARASLSQQVLLGGKTALCKNNSKTSILPKKKKASSSEERVGGGEDGVVRSGTGSATRRDGGGSVCRQVGSVCVWGGRPGLSPALGSGEV